jgi:hypothetical protein
MTAADILGAAAGGGLSAYALFNLARAGLAARWPSTLGEIAEARYVERPGDDNSPHMYVAYRYRVGDRPFRNDRVQFGLEIVDPPALISRDDDRGDTAADSNPTNAPVRVYYNPRRPEDSVLHRWPHWTVWPSLGGGLVFLYLGLREIV